MFVTVLLCLAHTMRFELICVAALMMLTLVPMLVYLVYQNRQLHKALEFMSAKMQWMETRPGMWIEACHEAYLRELWNSRHHLYPVIHPRDDSTGGMPTQFKRRGDDSTGGMPMQFKRRG